MTIAEFIFNFLSEKQVDNVFMVSGGQAMFLDDALYRSKNINVICTHHEQAAGMAAEAYGRITGKLGVALVTAGPGSVNVISGVVGGWTDSSPMMIISGQSNSYFVDYQRKSNIRQFGIQGIDIKPLVNKITKFFVTVDDPSKILFYLQKAYYYAFSGRPGPVWIDVPLDIQSMEVPFRLLEEFIPEENNFDNFIINAEISKIVGLILESKRPIIIAGQGLRLGSAILEFNKLVEITGIPVVTSRLGIDLIDSNNRQYVGRPGNYGERAAHFAIQNSDLIISLGCRLAASLVGHNAKDFGRNAKKVVIDIDREELKKPGINIDFAINADIKIFLSEMLKQLKKVNLPDYNKWVDNCNYWKKKYPVVLESYKDDVPVNSYFFTDRLSKYSKPKDMILLDTGSCFHVVSQVWKIKKGQRFLTTGGLSSMGYWAAGLGACVANNRKRTIVITGDGSLQFNIQELATIKHNKLPIKLFIFNNNGYLLIRQTQKNFMDGRLFGESPKTGVWCPDALKIADAYEIKGVRISHPSEVDKKIEEVMEYDGPVICDVITPEWQLIIPRIASEKLPDGTLIAKPYEDMYPFLDREELRSNMIIKPEDEK